MTVQTVSPLSDLAMLLAAVALAALLGAIVVQAVRRRPRAAAALACAAGALVVVYGTALVAAGLSGETRALRPGDAKCFDDWCAAMVSATDAADGTLVVDVQVQNRGRGRAMRANLAQAYLELPDGARVAPRDGSGLLALLAPGERADVPLTFAAPAGVRGSRFVVVEGGGGLGPGTFEIGGEGSPFHGAAGWPL